jgi:hypothetical protein
VGREQPQAVLLEGGGESFDFGGLEETDEFEAVAHEGAAVVGQARDHGSEWAGKHLRMS